MKNEEKFIIFLEENGNSVSMKNLVYSVPTNGQTYESKWTKNWECFLCRREQISYNAESTLQSCFCIISVFKTII